VFDELGCSTNWGVRRTGEFDELEFDKLEFDELEFDELEFDELEFDKLGSSTNWSFLEFDELSFDELGFDELRLFHFFLQKGRATFFHKHIWSPWIQPFWPEVS
jgi:hypothetical protein